MDINSIDKFYIMLHNIAACCIVSQTCLIKVLKIILVDNIDMCIQFYAVLSSLDYATSRLGTSAPYIRSMSEIATVCGQQ